MPASKKAAKKPLIEFNFDFYDEKGPSLQEVNDEGKSIGRPHCEVSKRGASTRRFFKAKIFKAGRYAFNRFSVKEDSPYFLAFQDCRRGWFIIDENRNLTLERLE